MEQTEKTKLKNKLQAYFREIHKIYTEDSYREESFYPALKILLEECSNLFLPNEEAGILVQPKKTEVGIPDFLAKKDGEIIGYIEAKTPDTNLIESEDSEQLQRYRKSLPNLILTNFLEFRLYRDGKILETVEVGRQSTLRRLAYPPVPEKLESFFNLLYTFYSFSTPEIHASSDLSIELAKRTRFLEHLINEELKTENTEIIRFYNAFREELIEGLTEERFADLYAQTITYGLFAARMKFSNKNNRESTQRFKKELAWESIPPSLSLLKEIFYSFSGPHLPESISWIVDDITQVLEKADIPSILKEFEVTRWDVDPVIHFYETFLATYNPEERQRLGVYYTPLPIVSYITRSIHKLLKTKFGKAEGLATRDVTLLDPSAGTLTFVVQAIKQVQEELTKKKQKGLIQAYIEDHILPHFHAFEILVAPYTVGHFKVSMILDEMGYTFKKGERFQFYLTNTLELKTPKQTSVLVDLVKEGNEAKRIKEEVPILVILGNPPYSVSSENKSQFIETLMETYKEDVKSERNIQPLSDDYIKFIRFAHWKIEEAGKGILGFVTNNSYLSGIIHRGMRRKLLETFDDIYILNLHGSSRIGEKTPEGGKDENVFDIQQGVAIALYVKLENQPEEKKIYYADLWGLQEKKYKTLLESDVEKTEWKKLKPTTPHYFFIPKDFALLEKYKKFWKLTDVFNKWTSGIETGKDKSLVAFTKEEKVKVFIDIFNPKITTKELEIYYGIKSTSGWKIENRRENLFLKDETFNRNNIIPYSYHPFDVRYTYYSNFLRRPHYQIMKHIIKNNLAIVIPRLLSSLPFKHALVTQNIGDRCYISLKTKETGYFLPLFLYIDQPDDQIFDETTIKSERIPNFTTKFIRAIKESLGMTPTPEKIFYYIYAILYAPIYRQRYQEFLKIDFPRVPLPSNREIFNALSRLGKELVDLHLLKHKALDKTKIGFPESGSDTMEKVIYDEDKKSVYINPTQYFAGISKEVWEYRIGAYQVMEKYLKDRKKRRLSLDEINHYIKVAKAILLTIKLQEKVDEVYMKIK